MNAITIKNLKKIYATGIEALKGINLDVKEGDFCALLGANGAGKTTVIGILTGLVIKSSGEVKVFDYDIDIRHTAARKMIGVVPQEMNFNMFEKVKDIVINQAGYFGIRRSVAEKDCEQILKELQLWDKRDTASRQLSGGMKRRLMIARALINHPKILILDEPTAGVDVELRHSMWEYLRKINQQGTTILLTTHYLEEVEQMCRHAAFIKNGEIFAYDSVKRLIKQIDMETYVVHVEKISGLNQLAHYNVIALDEHTFEAEITKGAKLNDFILKVGKAGMIVTDLRPKGNRMEKLFLNILKQ
ncbi:MAG: ABC transporter ATP-binding protein [Candidatus Omnitrophica bacterium]|nr:ABC transporter ATP-binding protein [Candidatus Omnitrophota bacterium]MCB9747990.1 ABC transporter ATP-binding protein [Candidatus Omnitrophota bacterium]